MHILQDLKELLDDSKLYLLRWADEYTDLVQGGFQELFTNLVDHFLFLCVRSVETPSSSDKSQSLQTVTPSLIILASLLSVYLYQTAVPQITEVSIFTISRLLLRTARCDYFESCRSMASFGSENTESVMCLV